MIAIFDMNLLTIRVSLTFAVLFSASFSAIAGDSGSDELFSLSLEQLINIDVTIANDRDVNELNAFGSFEKISENEWSRFGARYALDALKYVPGVDTHESLGGSTSVSIRGYTGNSSSARGKALLYDGIPLNGYSFATGFYTASFLSSSMLSSVELAKGPISSFYGSDAFHGAILLNPWDADAGFGSDFRTSYSSDSNRSVHSRSAYDIGQGVKGVTNLAYQSRPSTGLYADSIGRRIDTEIGALAISQHLLFDHHRVGVLHSTAETDDYYDIFSSTTHSKAETADTTLLYYRSELEMADGLVVKPAVWYNNAEFDFRLSNDSSVEAWHDIHYGFKVHGDYVQDSQALKFGVEYANSRVEGAYSHAIPGPVLDSQFSGLAKKIYSGFVHYQKGLFEDRLMLDGGLRLDHYSTTKANEFSPKIGLIWFFDAENVVKLIAAEGYRAPAASELAGNGRLRGNDALEGERLRSYEAIYMRKQGHLNFQLSAFVNRWRDAITAIPTPDALAAGFSGEYCNTGGNSAKGLETKLSYLYQPASLLGFISGSYVRSENDDSGADYRMFPMQKLAYGLRYESENWDLALTQLHKYGRKANGNPGTLDIPNFSELSAHAAYKLAQGSVSITVKNVLDRDNVEPGIWDISSGIPQAGVEADIALNYSLSY
jgi:outer membrane receptor for ferrienterochelin and colicin